MQTLVDIYTSLDMHAYTHIGTHTHTQTHTQIKHAHTHVDTQTHLLKALHALCVAKFSCIACTINTCVKHLCPNIAKPLHPKLAPAPNTLTYTPPPPLLMKGDPTQHVRQPPYKHVHTFHSTASTCGKAAKTHSTALPLRTTPWS